MLKPDFDWRGSGHRLSWGKRVLFQTPLHSADYQVSCRVTHRTPPSNLPAVAPRACWARALCVMASGQSGSPSSQSLMDYETKILPHLGGYGRYNRVVVIFSWFPAFAVTLNLFSGHFFTLIPDTYHCRPDPSLLPSTLLPSNFSEQSYLNLTIPWDGNSGLSHCELFKYPPNVSDLSGKAPRERVSCTRGWEYSTVAGLQSNIVTDVSKWVTDKKKEGKHF